ncbi:hypothetical protein [Thermus sediminis]|uniref:hypothetical protein n=1 Tax=Thermus sediminis TaxID=1761908 RepID=UPI000E3D8502|nr:hypothetical protein [Thermus sediminis]
MRRAFAFLLFLSLAWACGDRPYTLETQEGLLGGEEMSYDGEALVFEGRACLEGKGFRLEAPRIAYLEAEGAFRAEGLRGEAEGWRLEAERLEGRALRGVRLSRGRLLAEVAELSLASPPEGRGVLLTAPAYRVRAERAAFTRGEARLRGFLATPCPCGEDLRLSLEEATFLVDTGELKGEASLGLWGLEVPLGEAQVDLNRPPRLESPLVLSASETGGYTLGLQGFPLPRPGEEVGRWERRLTLLATGLTTPKEALLLGLREGGRGMEVRLGHGAGVRAFFDDLLFAATPSPPDADTPRLEARYTPRLSVEGAELRPFLRYTETGRAEGWTLGLEARYPWALREGPWSLGLDPGFLLALYPGADPYLSLGGALRGGYREGELWAELAYRGRWEPFGPRNRFAFEARPEGQRLDLALGYGALEGRSYLENPLGNRLVGVEVSYQDRALGRFRVGWREGSYPEWLLGYAMPEPDRSCCQALWLAPEVGLSQEGVSRYGLTLRLYDGCFAYELKAQNVLKGQYAEATEFSLTFALRLR